MKIGILKEVVEGERRVSATPSTVEKYRKLGLEVLVQAGAGEGGSFADAAYAEAGAKVVEGAAEVWAASDLVLKVQKPSRLPGTETHEANLLREGAALIGFLWPGQNKELVERLAARKATALAMDAVPRISRAQKLDALSAMANVVGYRAVVEAASRYGGFFSGQITAAGRIKPAQVLVLGAGVAGLAAIAAARGLGALVRAFDTRSQVREQVESLGATFVEFTFKEEGEGAGGYAKEMSEAYIAAEQALIASHAKEVDIIISTALIPGRPAPQLITSGAVVSMRPGSVIVDLAAEQGGNCALTERDRAVERYGVTIVGFTDMASRMARQSSELYAMTVYHLLAEVLKGGTSFTLDLEDEVQRGALVLQDGKMMWPPPTRPKPRAAEPRPDGKVEKRPALHGPPPNAPRTRLLLVCAILALGALGVVAPPEFLQHLTVFLLACVIGWHVIWNVSPALHTPLMSVTNAISGIILIGGMLLIGGGSLTLGSGLALVAILLASINVAGGFLVTQRMLRMFHRLGEPRDMPNALRTLAYITASMLFILSLRGLSNQESARRGNLFGAAGMILAVLVTAVAMLVPEGGPTILDSGHAPVIGLLALSIGAGSVLGAILAARVAMTAMPELVAILHSFVGAAAVLVGIGTFLDPQPGASSDPAHEIEIFVGVFVGAITFTGSVVAFAKLKALIGSKPLVLPARHAINLVAVLGSLALGGVFLTASGPTPLHALLAMTAIAALLGAHLVLAIGGGDMPVVVSLLNSYSGWAAAAAGFMLSNDLLIITGALVGSSGAILSYIMCTAMNRSIWHVIFAGFGEGAGAAPRAQGDEPAGKVVEANVEQVAELLLASKSVIIVPGYGMAVAQAQHPVKEITTLLAERGVKVRYAIHPVAGRLPGHMNVLLAEANVSYDIVKEMEEINDDFPDTDTVIVIGANDIVNPSALTDASSPIYGMPVLEAWRAGRVVMLKRGMAAGYAGVDNPICYKDNTLMLFGDAKSSINKLLTNLRATTS